MKILPQGIPIFCKIYSYIKLYFLFFIVSMQNFYTDANTISISQNRPDGQNGQN
jgi:hypothetical protein